MKLEHVLFSSIFLQITDPCARRSFLLCSHHSIFGTNKNRILEFGSCERALKVKVCGCQINKYAVKDSNNNECESISTMDDTAKGGLTQF